MMQTPGCPKQNFEKLFIPEQRQRTGLQESSQQNKTRLHIINNSRESSELDSPASSISTSPVPDPSHCQRFELELGNAAGQTHNRTKEHNETAGNLKPLPFMMASYNLQDLAAKSLFGGISHMQDTNQFCDLKVTIKGKLFLCHRVVMGSVSEFFKTRLETTSRNTGILTLKIDHKDVSTQIFGSLLDILYKGKELVTHEKVTDFMKISHFLGIDFLTTYCKAFILGNLTTEHCLDFWQCAQTYKLANLAENCYRWAAENIERLPREKFLALPKSMLLIVLSLQTRLSMDDVCKTVFSLVEADLDTRKGYLTEFLPFISFPQLSSSYLSDLLRYLKHEFSDVLYEGITEGLHFHLKGIIDKDANLQTQILAWQSVRLNLPEIQSLHVVVGGQNEFDSSHQEVCVINYNKSFKKCYTLASVPQNTGLHFASCTVTEG